MKPAPGPYTAVSISMLAFMTVLIANLALGLTNLDVGARQLIDTDGYMRYARIVDLVQGTNGWFDGWIHWSNSPFGHSMHWTRPLDALVILLAAPFAPFIGWAEAVYWAGLLTGPLFHLTLIGVVIWGARRIMPPQAAALAGWVAGLQPMIIGYSLLGRLDHHVLITLIAMAILGATLASLQLRHQSAALAGSLSGVALWVSTEALLIIGLSAVSIAFWWVIRGGPIRIFWWWSVAFAATSIIAGFIELGTANFFSIEYDRISLPYLTTAIAMCAGVTALMLMLYYRPSWEKRGISRLASFVLSLAIPSIFVFAAFPGLLQGPFADTPQRVWDIWLSQVSESQPMWVEQASVGLILWNLATPMAGFICALVLSRRRHGEQKILWATIAVWLLILIPLAANSARLALYPQALAGLPIAAVAWAAILRWGRGSSIGRVALRLGIIVSAIILYSLVAVVAYVIENDQSQDAGLKFMECDVSALAQDIDSNIPHDGIILAHIDLGPMLRVTSGRHVIATPHHRNIDGILEAYDIMRLPPNEARISIERRGIDAIVVCSAIDENYLAPIPGASLYQHLVDKNLPSWIQEVRTDTPESRLFLMEP